MKKWTLKQVQRFAKRRFIWRSRYFGLNGATPSGNYVTVDGRPEHVYIMEKLLGRRLRKGEIVHHINCVRWDNRPENLQLCKSRAEHVQAHKFQGTWNSGRKPRELNYQI